MDERGIRDLFVREFKGVGVMFDEPMKLHTSLRIGGPADVFVSPPDGETLSRVLKLCRMNGLNSLALGGGTNLLVRDRGVEGVVLSMASFSGMEALDEEGGFTVLRVGAGTPLRELVAYSKRKGLRGLEGLAGIPGQVGGAIAGNAGSYGTEMKDVISTVTLIDPEGGTRVLRREEIAFGYRRSELPPGSMVLGAELRLARGRPDEVARNTEKWLETKKKTQPLGKRSAGCVFKNPPGDSAGRLIDRAGCKGMREGAIEVSGLHADFFINTGDGSALDFLRLMDRVAERVRAAFGIELEPEIRIVGRC